ARPLHRGADGARRAQRPRRLLTGYGAHLLAPAALPAPQHRAAAAGDGGWFAPLAAATLPADVSYPRLERPLRQGTRPYQEIGPGATWQILDPRELWHFRDLLATLASRDVKLRYRQTALGVIWDLIQPVVPAFILAVVFGKIAKVPSGGVPPFVFVYVGM